MAEQRTLPELGVSGLSGVAFLCKTSGRGRRCERVELDVAPSRQVAGEPPPPPPRRRTATGGELGPGWRCLVPGCYTKGKRQRARSGPEAMAAFSQHYREMHAGSSR
ncbi:hypothetical protein ACIBH1_45675 [Nonomuraea sp. NPDC050663]|uniref:hypothetical protein n=1 Tax=Nonomuraea sp. NPDC050663 TaxID=3364370 RepID=UPI00378DBC29